MAKDIKGAKSAEEKAAVQATGTIKLTLVRSVIGYPKRQGATVRALGLHRTHETIEKADTPDNRSMAASISHLVRVESGEDTAAE